MSTSTKIKQMESVLSVCSPRKLRALLRKYGYTVNGSVSLEMVNSAVAKYGDAFRVEFAKIVKTGIRREMNLSYVDGEEGAAGSSGFWGGLASILGAGFVASQYWGIDFSGARKKEAEADIAYSNAQGFLANSSLLANQEKTKQILWTVGILAVVVVVIVLALRRKK